MHQERQTVHVVDSVQRDEPLRTPVTSEHLVFLRRMMERNVQCLDDHSRQCFQKFANGAEKALSARDLLFHENDDLIKQNNESHVRASIKSTVVGKGLVMSFEEIREAQKKREEKEAAAAEKRMRKRKSTASVPASQGLPQSRAREAEDAHREFRASGLEQYCSVFSL